MSDWLEQFYADVDAMRMDEFLDHFTDDGVVVYANNPPAHGKQQIGEAIGGLWASIDGLRHEFHERYDRDDRTIIEAAVTYTRRDGSEVTLPAASAFGRRDDKVESLTVYMDLAPLFAIAPADALSA